MFVISAGDSARSCFYWLYRTPLLPAEESQDDFGDVHPAMFMFRNSLNSLSLLGKGIRYKHLIFLSPFFGTLKPNVPIISATILFSL